MANIFEINSAIEQVIESNGNDGAAASTIIHYAQSLPEIRLLKDKKSSRENKNIEMLTGYTGEAGNVAFRNQREKKEKTEWFADQKARVGHYRLWAAHNQIFFHHYWSSDLTTGNLLEEQTETFVLTYNPETLEMESFGKIAYETDWRQTGLFTRTREILLVLLDREHEGKRMPFGEYKLRQIIFNKESAARINQYLSTPVGKLRMLLYSLILIAISTSLLIYLFP